MAMQHIARKAFKLIEVDQATRFNEPIEPDHEFFVDFSHVRGDFEEPVVYKRLNVMVDGRDYKFDPLTSSAQKVLFFLGGMRGSGKTTELAKYAKNLHRPDCFFVVTCNVDVELDMNDIEYTDVLIFQMEKLISALKDKDVDINKGALEHMRGWFAERDKEISKTVKAETGLDVGVGLKKDGLLSGLLGLVANFKAGLSGSKEWVNSVRTTFKNKFPDFAIIFNSFIEEVNIALRKKKLGQEVLFIVDGLEKTMTAELRRKIIVNESNRLQSIKAYTIFTLPIELMRERQRLMQFSYVESFPFVKLSERNGKEIGSAFSRFREFVYKRVDKQLFQDEQLVNDMIRLSGGSPRELLRILNQVNVYRKMESGELDREDFDRASKRMASQISQYITTEEWDELRKIKGCNDASTDVMFNDVVEDLLEKILVMEYNDGSDKRPNPLLTLSKLYQQQVVGQG